MKRLLFLLLLIPVLSFGQSVYTYGGKAVTYGGDAALSNIAEYWTEKYIGDEIVTGNNSSFEGAGNWVDGFGSGFWDVNSTVADNLYLDFTASQNEAVKLPNTLTLGEDNYVEIKIKKISGSGIDIIQVGNYSSSESSNIYWLKHQSSDYSVHRFTLRSAASSGNLYIGCIAAGNLGGEYAIDYVKVWTVDSDVEDEDYKVTDFNVNDFLSSYDETKKLFKILIWGNSILANYVGGTAFDDEGEGKRPPRLTVNGIPRRIYDYIVDSGDWNIPVFRRIDNGDWSFNDVGNWTDTDGEDFLVPEYTPAGYATLYSYTQTANEYAEITIPDGYENACLIFHKDDNEFGQDYEDAVAVTINGGDISSYGDATINTYHAKYQVNDAGNQFFHSQYEGMPAGANTIRITKANNTKTMTVWGVMYWTGNAVWVINAANGGKSMNALYLRYIWSQLYDNAPDAVLFEITGMNEASSGKTLNTSQKDFEYNINTINQVTDNVILFSTHPFGDNGAGTNFYQTLSEPYTLKETYQRIQRVIYRRNLSYIDIFGRFETLIIDAGGTLWGGEGGLTYTSDGQHPNTVCTELFSGYINTAIAW